MGGLCGCGGCSRGLGRVLAGMRVLLSAAGCCRCCCCCCWRGVVLALLAWLAGGFSVGRLGLPGGTQWGV